MGNKVTEELLSIVRSVVGPEFSDMDLIRALHMAKNDPTAAINIVFDTPSFAIPRHKSQTPSPKAVQKTELVIEKPISDEKRNRSRELSYNASCRGSNVGGGIEQNAAGSVLDENKWWLVGYGELSAFSTCKGRRVKAGDEVIFTFPLKSKSASSPSSAKGFGKGRQVLAACSSDIVRFSNRECEEIGRIPNDWSRCLLPLVRDEKVRIKGYFKCNHDQLGIMETVLLSIW